MAVSTQNQWTCVVQLKVQRRKVGIPREHLLRAHRIASLSWAEMTHTAQVEGNAEEYYHKPYLVSQSNVIDCAMYIVRNHDFVVAEEYNTNNTV